MQKGKLQNRKEKMMKNKLVIVTDLQAGQPAPTVVTPPLTASR